MSAIPHLALVRIRKPPTTARVVLNGAPHDQRPTMVPTAQFRNPKNREVCTLKTFGRVG